MNITTIGRGNVGGALARLWRRAGHTVVCLGRDGGDASAADAVLVAVPSGKIAAALGRVRGIDGKIAIDAMNAFDGRNEHHESLSHEVRSIIGGPVAKAFNLQHHLLYDHVDQHRARPSNLYAAEAGARSITEQLIRDAGFDPVFVGGIDKARALEDCARLFGAVRMENGGPHFHRFATPGNL
jgi:8-hydroxy-5-deazaflavin:NADPH oxidoreductase